VSFVVDAKNPTVFEDDSPCILALAPKHSLNQSFPFEAARTINESFRVHTIVTYLR
jgi:hypothetical protein